MTKLSLLSASELQHAIKEYLLIQRKSQKFTRKALASVSTVPASTIKKFETSGQISLRQFLLLWQCLDDLSRINTLLKDTEKMKPPTSIAEVLQQ